MAIRSLLWPDPRVKPPFGAAEVDWTHPLAVRLLGYWPLNERAGAPVNLAALQPGTSSIEGTPEWQSSHNMGPVLDFTSGSSDAVKLGANTADFGFSGTPASMGVIWKSSAINTFAVAARNLLANDGWEFLVGSGSVAGDVTFRTLAFSGNVWSGTADGRFHHATATFSPTTCVQYGDGVQKNSNGGVGIGANSQALYLGRRNTNYYTGQVGLIYVYARALTAEQVRWLHHEPYAMLRPIVRRRHFVISQLVDTTGTRTGLARNPGIVSNLGTLADRTGVLGSEGPPFSMLASQIRARRLASIEPAAVAGDVTITPAAGTLSIAGEVPTVRTTTFITPTVGSVVITGVAPGVVEIVLFSRTPLVGALSFGAIAPVIVLTDVRGPPVAALDLVGAAPVLLQTTFITPSTGTLTLTGIEPTVSNGGASTTSITPAVGTLTLTGVAPGLHTETRITPDTATLTLTGETPVVRTTMFLTPAVATVLISGAAPELTLATPRTPTIGTLTLTGVAPTLLHTTVVTPAAAALAIAEQTPTVRTETRITPAVATLTITGLAPSVVPGTFSAPTAGALVLAGAEPTVRTITFLTPSGATLTLAGLAPTVAQIALLTPTVATLTIDGLAPAERLSVIPVPGSVALTGTAPVVRTEIRITPAVATLGVVGAAPTCAVTTPLTPAAAAVAVAGVAPIQRLTVMPSAGGMTLEGRAATLGETGVAITPGPAALMLQGATPGLTVLGPPLSVGITSAVFLLPRRRAASLLGARTAHSLNPRSTVEVIP